MQKSLYSSVLQNYTHPTYEIPSVAKSQAVFSLEAKSCVRMASSQVARSNGLSEEGRSRTKRIFSAGGAQDCCVRRRDMQRPGL